MAQTKVRFDRAVEGATNIVDSGTEGTKLATGTTGQRGSTTGQFRFNTTSSLGEYYDGTGFKILDTPPTVTSVDVSEVDSQAGGNQTIVITGSNFASGAVVTFVGSSANFNASTTTVNSSSQITAVAPKASFLNAQEPYGIKVLNSSGLSGQKDSVINIDSSPTWTTSAGQIGGSSIIEGVSGSTTVAASDSDGDTIAYSVQSGSLPSGMSLNTSSGAITGTPSAVSGNTTSSFTLRATANSKTADRAFNIVVQENTITNHASSNWSHAGLSANRAESDGRYLTSSTSGATGYLWSVSSENASSGEASHQNSWLTSDNNEASSYWRGQGTGSNQAGDNLEMWFAGREVTITNLKLYSYNSSNYTFQDIQIQYWNGSDWIKTVGINGFSGNTGGWSWTQSGGNNRVNTITYTGSHPETFKSTNWRINYGPNAVSGSDDVVHQNGASNLSFKILG